jgi:hypothetical protein
MQMKIDTTLQRARISRIEDGRKSETAQTCGKQRRRSPLAASDKKLAPAMICWIKIDRKWTGRRRPDRMPRLPLPTQTKAPWMLKCGTEI